MRPAQFWLLLAASFLVTGLLFRGIFLFRSVEKEHRVLVDSQQAASTATEYQRMWKTIATRLYQDSAQDPALAQILKDQHIRVHPNGSKAAEAPGESAATPEPGSTPVQAAAPATTSPIPSPNAATPGSSLPVPTLGNVKP